MALGNLLRRCGLCFLQAVTRKTCCVMVFFCLCWYPNASVGKQCINFSVIKLIKNPSPNTY